MNEILNLILLPRGLFFIFDFMNYNTYTILPEEECTAEILEQTGTGGKCKPNILIFKESFY